MPIITKGAVAKGAITTVTLDKAALAAHTKVAADTYFSNQLTWGAVSVLFVSATGNQKKTVLFKAADLVPEAKLGFSDNARDVFQVHSLTIHDKDGGELFIPASDLNAANFDIDMSPLLALWSRDFLNPTSAVDNETLGGSGGQFGFTASGLQLGGSGNGYNFYYRSVPAGFDAGALNYKVIVNYEITVLPTEACTFELSLGSGFSAINIFNDARFSIGVHTEEFLLTGDASLNASFTGANSIVLTMNGLKSQNIYIKSASIEVVQ